MPMDDPSPRSVAARRFTLLDGMITVAALAVELGLIRAMGLGFDWEFHSRMWTEPDWFFHSWMLDQLVEQPFELATTAALTSTLAAMVFRLRRPRPPWRRLARQPGVSAVMAAVAAWMILVPDLALGFFQPSEPYSRTLPMIVERGTVPVLAGFGVVTIWGTLALSRRWRAEPSWVDRLGRFVGVGWIALALWGIYLRTVC